MFKWCMLSSESQYRKNQKKRLFSFIDKATQNWHENRMFISLLFYSLEKRTSYDWSGFICLTKVNLKKASQIRRTNLAQNYCS